MIYVSGQVIQLGDMVNLGGGQGGIVVGIIEEGRYADGYHEKDWEYLNKGLVLSTDFGDLRLDGPDEDLELVARRELQYRRVP